MAETHRIIISLGAGLAVVVAAGAAHAGATTSGCGCVPTSHQVTVPGVSITPPSVTVTAPSLVFTGAGASSSASASASSSSSAFGSSLAGGSSGVIYNGGGGSNWYVEQGSAGVIPNLRVEGVESGQARRICTQIRDVQRVVAIQATCLDDKDVPHPASQVGPDRDIADNYEGEVYRCIAGTRMQYTIGAFAGRADFDHGQTITCGKFQALYHSASGGLACRAQIHQRDCNERSLLRRFGAGIKVVKLAGARQCVAYRSEVAAGASTPTSMVLDGGVGGVVH